MKKRHGFLLLYLLLLGTSHLWRARTPPVSVPPELASVKVSLEGGGEGVRIAYREWPEPSRAADDAEERPVVLLLHGSPGSSRDFRGLGPLLARGLEGLGSRVLAPDLPGFGDSERDVPDYSIRAHGRYLRAFLDELSVAEAQVVGFSMGGGVALELWELAPERVGSITLLSAIGVQELELLGNYHVNHALHGVQLAGLWALFELMPHFGALDGAMLSPAYARNFFDSDQRPLRRILGRFDEPMLILHGDRDVLVPAATAREHHRLVPQSELVVFDANHFLLFRRPELLAKPLTDFLDRVEKGETLGRGEASPERLRQAAEPFRAELPEARGLALAVWVLLLAGATMLSEDLTCIVGGLMAASGRLGYLPAAAACTVGIFLGDLLLYATGRFLGRPWLGRPPLSWWVSRRTLERSARWLEERGARLIFATRFVPGTRLPTYVAAGMLRMNAWTFTTYLFVPVAIWAPLLVGASYLLGDRILSHFEAFSRYALPAVIGSVLALWLVLALARTLGTHRGRRLVAGWWQRWTRWEFWPPWLFYPPVVAYVLWLGLKHRCPTLFTAANPGIGAGGGFLGESKSAILDELDPRWMARYELLGEGLSAAEKVRRALAFQEREGLGFPLVLKPDVGQRGAGVRIVRTPEEVEAYLARAEGATIVQEYLEGPELGVFYLRLPSWERGRIFSITDKRLPEVEGDGESTVEELILGDPRAVAMSQTYFRAMEERLDEVPAAGERLRLVELGTHCRGAVFLDGESLRTPELEAAVERVARSFSGFYFGRFDLRGTSHAAFRAGRDFRVLELNGVTSEATHIYDPGTGLRQAWRVLAEQWRLAFEIGARNREAGARVLSLGQTLGLLLRRRTA